MKNGTERHQVKVSLCASELQLLRHVAEADGQKLGQTCRRIVMAWLRRHAARGAPLPRAEDSALGQSMLIAVHIWFEADVHAQLTKVAAADATSVAAVARCILNDFVHQLESARATATGRVGRV